MKNQSLTNKEKKAKGGAMITVKYFIDVNRGRTYDEPYRDSPVRTIRFQSQAAYEAWGLDNYNGGDWVTVLSVDVPRCAYDDSETVGVLEGVL